MRVWHIFGRGCVFWILVVRVAKVERLLGGECWMRLMVVGIQSMERWWWKDVPSKKKVYILTHFIPPKSLGESSNKGITISNKRWKRKE